MHIPVGGQRKNRFITLGLDEVALERALNGREEFGQGAGYTRRENSK